MDTITPLTLRELTKGQKRKLIMLDFSVGTVPTEMN
jgi:hypothetical protein